MCNFKGILLQFWLKTSEWSALDLVELLTVTCTSEDLERELLRCSKSGIPPSFPTPWHHPASVACRSLPWGDSCRSPPPVWRKLTKDQTTNLHWIDAVNSNYSIPRFIMDYGHRDMIISIELWMFRTSGVNGKIFIGVWDVLAFEPSVNSILTLQSECTWKFSNPTLPSLRIFPCDHFQRSKHYWRLTDWMWHE